MLLRYRMSTGSILWVGVGVGGGGGRMCKMAFDDVTRALSGPSKVVYHIVI